MLIAVFQNKFIVSFITIFGTLFRSLLNTVGLPPGLLIKLSARSLSRSELSMGWVDHGLGRVGSVS